MRPKFIITLLLIITASYVFIHYLRNPRTDIRYNNQISMTVTDIYDISNDQSIMGITFRNHTDEWITFGNTKSSAAYPFEWLRKYFIGNLHKPVSIFGARLKEDDPPTWGKTMLGWSKNRYPVYTLHTIGPRSSITVYTEIYNFNRLSDGSKIEGITYGFTYLKSGWHVNDSDYHIVISKPIAEEILQRYRTNP